MSRGRGELEQDVMGALWAHSQPVTARTVLQDIGDSALAYTTVKTVLERLTRKQVVNRVNVDRTWHYTAAASRDDYVAELMLRALDRTGARDEALIRFARGVTPADAEILRAALDDPGARESDRNPDEASGGSTSGTTPSRSHSQPEPPTG